MANQEYEVERILGTRQRNKKKEYLVQWRGFGPEENTWEPVSNLQNCTQILKDFSASQGSQTNEIPSDRTLRSKSPGRNKSQVKSKSPGRKKSPARSTRSTRLSSPARTKQVSKRLSPARNKSPARSKTPIREKSRTPLVTEFEKKIQGLTSSITSDSFQSSKLANGIESAPKTTITHLIKSSLDFSPLNLRNSVGRYPTVHEMRDFATKQSLEKVLNNDGPFEIDSDDDNIVVERTIPKQKTNGWKLKSIILIIFGIICIFAVILLLVFYGINFEMLLPEEDQNEPGL